MEKYDIKVDLLPNLFVKEDGTFNLQDALLLSGHIAGVCYDEEGFNHIVKEDVEKTEKRIGRTLTTGHHSVYDHVYVSLNLRNIPKLLAMILNNEKEYTTAEKSSRYTKIVRAENSIITEQEEELYNKWLETFIKIIKERYGNAYTDFKIGTLAQENARYLVTVFMPTQMVYTTSLRQINYIAAWMVEYMQHCNLNDDFDRRLCQAMEEFYSELKRLNLIEPRLMRNEKHRSFSLFGKDLDKKTDYFGDVYQTTYKGTFAELAQAQRHRTIAYQMEMPHEKEFFVPPIIENNDVLVNEWLKDMEKVSSIFPQGTMVTINERGTYENFILKCKERLCGAAQLEIMRQTSQTLQNYKKALEEANHPLAKDIVNYSHGARCTFPDYECLKPCGFNEGINLTRKI